MTYSIGIDVIALFLYDKNFKKCMQTNISEPFFNSFAIVFPGLFLPRKTLVILTNV